MEKVEIKITEKEKMMIKKIAESEYCNGNPAHATWSGSVCDTKSDNAVLGRLVKKGLVDVWFYDEEVGNACQLTDIGLVEYNKMRG